MLENIISGTSSVYVMIGHPIAQVQSPVILNRYFRQAKIDAYMAVVDIKPPGGEAFFEFLRHWDNCQGCIVTVPHKQLALRCVDTASARAKRIGAVNVVRRLPSGELDGDMVDGLGYLHALEKHRVSVQNKHMLLIGAGGVGSAIAHSAAEAGLARISVIDIDKTRQHALITSLHEHYPALSVATAPPANSDLDIVTNATPLGMRENDPLPYALEEIKPSALIADVVTLPVMTPWLKLAQEKGFAIQTGPEMTKPQIPLFSRHLGLNLDQEIIADLL